MKVLFLQRERLITSSHLPLPSLYSYSNLLVVNLSSLFSPSQVCLIVDMTNAPGAQATDEADKIPKLKLSRCPYPGITNQDLHFHSLLIS